MQPSLPDASFPPPSYTDTLTTYDGLALFVQGWHPEKPQRGAVVLVHGYAEHSDRYQHVAAFLTARGYAVHAYDQRGYGRSEGRRAFVWSFDEYISDLHDVVSRVRRAEEADCPLFLLGHSMGGPVCALYCLDHGARPAGLILSSPSLRVNEDMAPILRQLAGVVGRLAPTLPTVYLKHNTLSRDPAVVAWSEADPLNYHGRIRARTGQEILRAADHLLKRVEDLTVPLLIFHGTADRLIAVDGSRELYRRAGSSDKTLKLYEGFYHETMNEPENDEVLTDLADWLDAHTCAC